jgi:hypothetical protein
MNYVIAVLADRIQAESAYSALEQEALPMEQVSLVGKGYQSADEFDFIDPSKQSRKQAKLMSFWLVPFGFVGGVAFNLSTQYQLVPAVGTLGNQLIGGLLGAIGGAMGSFFVGGGFGLGGGKNNQLPYRNRLKEGKYILVVKGTPNITNKANRILRGCNPESLQSYVDPADV